MFYIIQLLVFIGICVANIRYGWIDNPYSITFLAAFAAWFVTMMITEGPLGFWRWLNRSPLEDGARSGPVADDGRVATSNRVRDVLPKQ